MIETKDYSELMEELKMFSHNIEEEMEIMKRARELGVTFSEAAINKKMDDGILQHIHTAKPYQLDRLFSSHRPFRYYPELNDLIRKIYSGGLEFVKIK